MDTGLAPTEAQDLERVLHVIWEKYQYDFKNYARASLLRRFQQILLRTQCRDLAQLSDRIVRDANFFGRVLQILTVPVTEMFRDPVYFKTIRKEVIPILATYPSIKIWVAGCSTGEEVYSYAILLHEAGLLKKTILYGTDINLESLARAKAAIFDYAQIRSYTENYQQSGGTSSFSDYYRSNYGATVLIPELRQHVVLSDHNLATDAVFSEVNLVSCRNVLIYFNRQLQNRAIGLFQDSLCRKGFLVLGSKENLFSSEHVEKFATFHQPSKIYRKIN